MQKVEKGGTMSQAYDIMAAGHLCIDIIPQFPDTGTRNISDIMRPGKLVNVGDAKISSGGPVSNTGIAMKILGSNVCFCACVGDDELGKLTVELVRKNGDPQGIHIIKNASSSYTIAIAPPNIDRIFLHNPGTNNQFGPEYLDSELISRCRHFHFGYPPLMKRVFENQGAGLQKVFQIAKEAGATTSCDVTLPDPDSPSGKIDWHNILQKVLPYIDVYLPSIEETLYMIDPQKFLKNKAEHKGADLIDYIDTDQYSELADKVLNMGAKVVALKSGHRGFYVKTKSKDCFKSMGRVKPGDFQNWSNREIWAPAFKPKKFGSATGSGDSAVAGFLSAFLRGLSIEKAVKYATCCGLQNVQVLDAVSGIHPWDETTKMLDENMPMIDIGVKAQGWNWSDQYQLWSGPDDMLSH